MAITFSNTATILTVTGATAGDTMRDVVTAVGDASVIELVGSVITLKRAVGQTYKALTFSNGIVLTLSAGDTLNIQGITNTTAQTIFTINTTSEFTIGAGCVIDFNSDNQVAGNALSRFYNYGKVTAIGTLGNEIIIKKYNNFYLVPYLDNDWQYVKFQDIASLGGSFIIPTNISARSIVTQLPIISMKYITIENTIAVGVPPTIPYYGYGIATLAEILAFPYTNYIFDNLYIYHINIGIYGTYNGNIRLTNSTIIQVNSYSAQLYGACGTTCGIPITTSKVLTYPTNELQPYFLFDNCVFDYSVIQTYLCLCYYGSRVHFKDCTFRNENTAVYSQYGSVVSFSGTNVFEGTPTPSFTWGTNGAFIWCKEVGITVNDNLGNPIDKACVSIRQSGGKEWYSGYTNSAGKLLNVWDEDVILAEKEETSTGVYQLWSESKDEYFGKGDSSTIYINTGIPANTITDFEISFRYNIATVDSIFGAYTGGYFQLNNQTGLNLYIGTSTPIVDLLAYAIENNDYILTITKTDATHHTVILYNSTTSSEVYNQNSLTSATLATVNLYIFARYTGASIDRYSNKRIYYFKINGETWTLNNTTGSTVTGDLGTVLTVSGSVSDFWGNQYHIITVMKEGYSSETQKIEVTEDKTLTFTLTPLSEFGSNLIGTTIHDSTIY